MTAKKPLQRLLKQAHLARIAGAAGLFQNAAASSFPRWPVLPAKWHARSESVVRHRAVFELPTGAATASPKTSRWLHPATGAAGAAARRQAPGTSRLRCSHNRVSQGYFDRRWSCLLLSPNGCIGSESPSYEAGCSAQNIVAGYHGLYGSNSNLTLNIMW
jgi:hypothetical protein